MIKISIITPTYNRAHTLDRVYDSLVSQSLQEFEWIVIDDGSTDNTQELVQSFIEKASFPIVYVKQENQHKFISIFEGLKLAKGACYGLMDSDDKLTPEALEILCGEFDAIPEGEKISNVNGLSVDEEGTVVGDKYPKDILDATIFDMRYNYGVKGDKWGIGRTSVLKSLPIDLDSYKGKGFIPESLYFYWFDKLGYKSRFINKVVRIYIRDEEDADSLANNFYSDKNSFGLCESYRMFLNTYSKKIFSALYLRNMVGYILFAIEDKRSFFQTVKGASNGLAKLFLVPLYPLVYLVKGKIKSRLV